MSSFTDPNASSSTTADSDETLIVEEVNRLNLSAMKDDSQVAPEEPPFDKDIHLNTPNPTEEQELLVTEMSKRLESVDLYQRNTDWADRKQIMRFLIARNFDIEAALKMITEALTWRDKRKPHDMVDSFPEWEDKMSLENASGKVYIPGYDRWGRSLIVFDNQSQNTSSAEDHMNFLAFNLELSTRLMKSEVSDKYIIFMHLNGFSIFTAPSFSETVETIHMLTTCFPERLGHCVCYQAPMYFRTVLNMVKGFLDPKTVSKLIFISGDVSDDSENDKLMKKIIGDDWKVQTGAEQPVYVPKSSPGYDHKRYWPTVLDRIEKVKSASNSRNTSEKVSAENTEKN